MLLNVREFFLLRQLVPDMKALTIAPWVMAGAGAGTMMAHYSGPHPFPPRTVPRALPLSGYSDKRVSQRVKELEELQDFLASRDAQVLESEKQEKLGQLVEEGVRSRSPGL